MVEIWIFVGIISLASLLFLFKEIRDKKLLRTVTGPGRGTGAEKDLVLKFLKQGIPAQNIFHDLYLKKNDGSFSQIDLVLVTDVGIIVFEVKDYSGWIFGTGHDLNWTQVLAYGKRKYRLYNSVRQNSRHISDLRSRLRQVETVPFYSVVVFCGNCVLKEINFVPNGTFLIKLNRVFEVLATIMKNNKSAHYTNINEVMRVLKESVKNGEDKEIQIQHIKRVRELLGKDRIFE